MTVYGDRETGGPTHPLTLTAQPDGVETYRLYVTAHRDVLPKDSVRVTFEIEEHSTHEVARHDSVFIGPAK